MDKNFESFKAYVNKFDTSIDMIKYKYEHSLRVVNISKEICNSLSLNDDETYLALVIALLHDVARFRQWSEYETFNDSMSFDHGDEGVKILFEEGEINNYIVNKEDYDIIKKAIINHNKLIVDFNSMDDREKLHSKIIRDADKLDIIYSYGNNYLRLIEDDFEISEDAKREFFNHDCVSKTSVKSKNDKIILTLSLVFNLYFKYSKEKVLSYVNDIYNRVENKELFKPYYEEVRRYLKGEI